jgi:phytoene/squalene synthetase
LALYRASLGRFWERRILRTGFCLLQSVDDLLDGDRPSEQEPLYVVDQLVQELESRQFSSDPLSRLASAFVSDLERIRNGRHDPLKDAVALIRQMQTDRRRVLKGNLMTEQQLREHHRRTFSLSLDLMLRAAGSPLRTSDCPALIDAFGWCSTMRDLEEDLSNGLVNIPQEVVDRARDQGVKDLSFQSLCLSDSVRDWMKRELVNAEKLLDAADAEINAVGSVEGVTTLSMFARSIRSYVHRYSRSLPGEKRYRAYSMEFVKERSPR